MVHCGGTSMLDMRPNLSVNGQMAKLYQSKKLNRLNLSKTPIIVVGNVPSTRCRETMIHRVGDCIRINVENQVSSSNPYILKPLIYETKKGKKYIGSAEINMDISPLVDLYDFYVEDENGDKHIKRASKLADYILGILTVAMSHAPEEKKEKPAKNYRGLIMKSTGQFVYISSSPFWLVSPITTSIMVGVARNCISHIMDDEDGYIDLDNDIFKKVTHKKVLEVIKSHDVREAQLIWQKVIKPFYKKNQESTSSYVVLANPNHIKVVDKLIKSGTYTYFKPDRCSQYWMSFNTHYGIFSFYNEFGTDTKTWNSLKEV